jgi:uncharacterized membrane protein
MDRERLKWLLPTRDRAQQAGMFLGTASVPLTYQKTLVPRSTVDQAIITGIVMALNHTIGALVHEVIEACAFRLSGAVEEGDGEAARRHRRHALALSLAAMGLGFAVQTAFEQRPDEDLRRASIRTVGFWLSAGAFAGLSVSAYEEAVEGLGFHQVLDFPGILSGCVLLAMVRESRRRAGKGTGETGDRPSLKPVEALALSSGIAAGLSGLSALERAAAGRLAHLLSRYLPGTAREWRPLGHAAVLYGTGYGVTRLMRKVYEDIEKGAERMEPLFQNPPASPAISGSSDSLVPWETLSVQGRRIISTYLRPQWIEDVMGEPGAAQPIRIFVGEDSAPSKESRVELALREMERTGAFERSLLMVISPTGTGFTNYVAVEAAEYLTRGDMASVTLQYGKRPSVLSLDLVPEARDQHRLFLEKLHEKLGERRPERRPRVVLFGESLGSWASEEAFNDRGTDGLLELGINRALWIGTPYGCKWKDQVLGPPRPDVDKPLVGVFNDFGQVEAMDPEARARLRYVMITHYNDGVALFGLPLLVQKPAWLGQPERRPPTIPPEEKYNTPTTFVQTLIDTKNAGFEIPGQFQATAHDYRGDLARFIREVYALEATEEQMARIEDALIRYEKARAAWFEEQKQKDKQDKHNNHNYKVRIKPPDSEGSMGE